MATMADLDELALALPRTTKELSDDGMPSYRVHGTGAQKRVARAWLAEHSAD